MVITNLVAFIVLLVGGLNWGLIGLFRFNLVSAIFGAGANVGSTVVYILVLLSALWLIFTALISRGRIAIMPTPANERLAEGQRQSTR